MAKKILNIKHENQHSETSCWACCGRLINNYYSSKNKKRTVYKTDEDFGKAVGIDINKYQDIQKALENSKIKCYDGQDDKANIPTLQEIKDAIDKDEALAVCVSAKPVKFPNNVKDAHYILIVGIDEPNKLIYIMDPDPRVKDVVPLAYNSTEYNIGHGIPKQYWGVTYYTKDHL